MDEDKVLKADGLKVDAPKVDGATAAGAEQVMQPETAEQAPAAEAGQMPMVEAGMQAQMAETGAPVTMTEAEARAMLIEDNARVREDARKASRKKRRMVMLAIIGVILLVGVGILVTVMLGGMHKDGGTGGIGDYDKQEGNNSGAMGEPSEEAEEQLDAEMLLALAQDLYGRFVGIYDPWDGTWAFRVDPAVQLGNPSRYMMLTTAAYNVKVTPCRGEHVITAGDMTYVEDECYAGEAMRQEIEKMYGQEMTFTADDVIGQVCGGRLYDPVSDEFYAAFKGCGGDWPQSIEGMIDEVEQVGDKIYIYEKALFWELDQLFHVGRDVEHLQGEYVATVETDYSAESSVNWDDYEIWGDWCRAMIAAHVGRAEQVFRENGDRFKWTFEKNGRGDYVFRGIERVE